MVANQILVSADHKSILAYLLLPHWLYLSHSYINNPYSPKEHSNTKTNNTFNMFDIFA